jgi:hypothetical protein
MIADQSRAKNKAKETGKKKEKERERERREREREGKKKQKKKYEERNTILKSIPPLPPSAHHRSTLFLIDAFFL